MKQSNYYLKVLITFSEELLLLVYERGSIKFAQNKVSLHQILVYMCKVTQKKKREKNLNRNPASVPTKRTLTDD